MQNSTKAQRRRERRAQRAAMFRQRAKHPIQIIEALERTQGHDLEYEPARRSTNGPGQFIHNESLATGEEIAQFLRVHLKTVERWRKSLGLPCLRIGGRIRYDLGDVTRWASARKEES